jgi:hypothetical protein
MYAAGCAVLMMVSLGANLHLLHTAGQRPIRWLRRVRSKLSGKAPGVELNSGMRDQFVA